MKVYRNNIETDDEETSRLLPNAASNSASTTQQSFVNKRISFWSKLFCCRNALVFLQFWGFVTVYGMRANLSVALVAMVNQTYAEQTSDHGIIQPECRKVHGNSSSDEETGGEDGKFNWDQATQGYILSAFFYGYIATQVPGGWLATRFGGKKVLAYGIFFTALFTGLTPIAARTGAGFLIAVRVLAGLSEGVTYPAASLMWSRWAPPLERTTFVVLCYTGGDFGAIVSLPISGWLSSLTFLDDGWPLAFYVFGALGLVWFVIWMALIHESPALHPRISSWEKQHILSGIGNSQDKVTKKYPTPWISILTSVPMWAMFFLSFAYGWSWYIFLTCIPSFFKEVLDFNIKQNGMLTALPFIASFIFKNAGASFSDWLQKQFGLSITFVRKLFGISGVLFSACLLVPVGFLGCDQTFLSVVLLTLSCGVLGLHACAGSTVPLDLSPRFSGITMALLNFGTNLSGVFSPMVAGKFTNHNPTRHQWKLVFYVAAAISLLFSLIFLIFGSAKEQPWNYPSREQKDEEESIINAVIERREVFADPSKETDSLTSSVRSNPSSVI